MKSQTLPVKRRPASKGIFRRLNAFTSGRKQRVTAAASSAAEMDVEDGSSKISRALTIIFLIHIVAIALIFFHQRFLDDRPGASAAVLEQPPQAATPRRTDLPRLSTGEKPYIVQTGDNYARIAEREGVDEGDLKLLNKNVDIRPDLVLKIPPKRIVAEAPPEIAAIRAQSSAGDDRGNVEGVDVTGAPRALLVHPNLSQDEATSGATVTSGKSYVVQPGDSIFRIAGRFHVSQDAIMKANRITDPRKLKAGMELVIPAH